MTVRPWALLAVLAAAACDTTVGHSNPYDPSTPPSLQAKAKLVGRIVFEDKGDGDDRSGARVSVKGLPDVFTQADGSYTLPEVPSGTWAVEASRDGYQPGSAFPVVVALSPESAVVGVPDIALRRARNTVRGTALLEGAARFSGIAVSLTPGGGATATDEAGNFVLAQVPTGTYEVVFSKEGFAELRRPGVSVAATGLTVLDEVTLSLRRDASLSGTVALEMAAPPTTASVKLLGTDVNGTTVEANTPPSAAGDYHFGALPAGTYWVQVTEPSFAPVQLPTVILGSGQAFALPPANLVRLRGSLAGRYELAQAKSHEGIQVGVQGLGAVAPVGASTYTDASGAFSFLALPVGTYQVTARKGADFGSDDQTVEVASAAPGHLNADPVTLAVVATAKVAGAVFVDKGPTAGTQVWLRGTDVRGLSVALSADTGSDGAFEFPALVAGAYQLSYERLHFEPASSATFVVSTGETMAAPEVQLRVMRGEVAGAVRLTAGAVASFQVGADASGVRVELDDETGAQVASTVTDSSGLFRFQGVAVSVVALGKHQLKATRENFSPASLELAVAPDVTTAAGTLDLPLSAGSLEGHAYLNDRLDASGRLSSHLGVAVSVSGVAFNGVAYSKAGGQSAADGSWSLGGLPPGTYEVQLAAANRRCGGAGTFPVRPGEAVGAGEVDCYDAVAPGAVALAAVPAWATANPLPVAIVSAAADSNLRGYQAVQGRLPDWSQAGDPAPATSFDFDLDLKEERTLWVRAVDWCGNAGPETYVTSRYDAAPPAVPAIHVPRATGDPAAPVSYINETTTSVTLTGAEGDPTFETYLACSAELADPAQGCAATPACTLAPSAASFVLQLTPGQRTCVWAQSRDLAQRTSASIAVASAVCDTSRPTALVIAPVYESSQFTVRAQTVEVFVEAGPTDLPLGDLNSPFKGIDYLEVDSGGGFLPLCPGCRSDADPDTWDPCSSSCRCADARLVCADDVSPAPAVDAGAQPGQDAGWARARRFTGVHLPLSAGSLNRLSMRAVDLAGNVGDGASLSVGTEGTKTFAQGNGAQTAPRFYKDLVAFSSGSSARVFRLGKDRLPGELLVDLPSSTYDSPYLRNRSCADSSAIPESFVSVGEAGIAFSASTRFVPGYDQLQWLPPGVLPASPGDRSQAVTLRALAPTDSPVSSPFIANVALAGKMVAWAEVQGQHPTLPNPDLDAKRIYACTPKECVPPCTPCEATFLGTAAGLGHVSGLRAGGDWLLWAEQPLTGDCTDSPRYRWRLTFLGDAPTWAAGKYFAGDLVWPTALKANGHAYVAVKVGPDGGVAPGGEPSWPTAPGAEVAGGSNGLVWRELTMTFEADQAAVSADGTLVYTADNGRGGPWLASTEYGSWQLVRPASASNRLYRVVATRGERQYFGKSGSTEPVWSAESGVGIVDGELTWMLSESTEFLSTPVTYRVFSAGPDGIWNSDDEPAPVANVSRTEMAQGGLAIERGRALAFGFGLDGATITDWEATPAGKFVGEERYLQRLPGSGGEPQSPEIAQGLLVYGYGSGNRSDLVALDLSTLRWESVGRWHDSQAIADDGTVLYADDDLFEKRLVAHRPDGTESTLALPALATKTGSNARAFLVTGEDLLYQCFVGSQVGLCATNAGPDHRFFTGDEPVPVVLDVAPSSLRYLVGNGGNAYYVTESSTGKLSGYLLQPAAPGGSLVDATPQPLVPTDGYELHPYLGPAVSGKVLLFTEQLIADPGVSALRMELLGTAAPRGDLVPTSYDPACSAVQSYLAAGSGVLLHCSYGALVSINVGTASTTTVLPGKLSRTLLLGDLLVQEDGSRAGIAFNGDLVGFIATTPTESAQIYTWDRWRNSLVQRTTHFSDKSELGMAPSGRMAWRDSLLNGYSTFVWLP